MKEINIQRGRDMRATILAIARAAQAKNTLFPTIERIAAALGICPEQTRRHIILLIDEGKLVTRRVGIRRRIKEIRP